MRAERPWVVIACLVKAKNNEGGLSVTATEGLPFLLSPGLEVTFVPPLLRFPRQATVLDAQETGEGRGIVWFDGIDDRSQAECVEGHFCLVSRVDLPEDAFIHPEPALEGFSVVDEQMGPVGVVSRIEENPAHPLLVVERTGGSEVLIPLVDAIVCHIDEDICEIGVELPPGMLDL